MNINKSIIKFCSACGSKLKAPVKSGQPIKCEKCPKTSYLDPKVAVGGVIINSSNQLLLVKRNIEPHIGKWSFPSGFVDSGEIIEEALKRMEMDDFGYCDECGENISKKRLLAVPLTRMCINCQSVEERNRLTQNAFSRADYSSQVLSDE